MESTSINYKTDNSVFYHIQKLSERIRDMRNAFRYIGINRDLNQLDSFTSAGIDRGVMFAFSSALVIDCISFLHEWDKYLTHDCYPNKNINAFKKCVEPITDILLKYKGLKDMRNRGFAHSFRYDRGDRKHKSIFYEANLGFDTTPKNLEEIYFLAEAILILAQITYSMYKQETDERKNFFDRIGYMDLQVGNLLKQELRSAYYKSVSQLEKKFPDFKLIGHFD